MAKKKTVYSETEWQCTNCNKLNNVYRCKQIGKRTLKCCSCGQTVEALLIVKEVKTVETKIRILEIMNGKKR